MLLILCEFWLLLLLDTLIANLGLHSSYSPGISKTAVTTNVAISVELEDETQQRIQKSNSSEITDNFWLSIYSQHLSDLELSEGQILIENPSIQLSHILEYFVQLKMISKPSCPTENDIKTKLSNWKWYQNQVVQLKMISKPSCLTQNYITIALKCRIAEFTKKYATNSNLPRAKISIKY